MAIWKYFICRTQKYFVKLSKFQQTVVGDLPRRNYPLKSTITLSTVTRPFHSEVTLILMEIGFSSRSRLPGDRPVGDYSPGICGSSDTRWTTGVKSVRGWSLRTLVLTRWLSGHSRWWHFAGIREYGDTVSVGCPELQVSRRGSSDSRIVEYLRMSSPETLLWPIWQLTTLSIQPTMQNKKKSKIK